MGSESHSREENWLLAFIRKRQKELYALGSILRGNDLAVKRFLLLDGPAILYKVMDDASLDINASFQSPTWQRQITGVRSKVRNLVQDLFIQGYNVSLIEEEYENESLI
jgi:hypothetical protein